MNVEEFLSTMDALRFDDSLDTEYPELRSMVKKVYPYIRQIYNMMTNAGLLAESHGQKKHNYPKDELHAMRKGNRDAERDLYGDGFKAKSKLHMTAKKDKMSKNKINVNNYDKFVDESKNTVKINESDLYKMVGESILRNMKRLVRESDERDYDTPSEGSIGMEFSWGKNIEGLIKQLSDIFDETNAPEENEWGFKQSKFDTMVASLKYYYEINPFDDRAFRAIYNMMDNYDLISDERVKNILLQLKKYC